MSADRNGKGHRAYRRKQAALKRRTAVENLPCGHGSNYGCGQPIDTTLPPERRLSFTADHPAALRRGGKLLAQTLVVPMHRGCSSRRGDAAPVENWEAS